jgi:hypothetical protein
MTNHKKRRKRKKQETGTIASHLQLPHSEVFSAPGNQLMMRAPLKNLSPPQYNDFVRHDNGAQAMRNDEGGATTANFKKLGLEGGVT